MSETVLIRFVGTASPQAGQYAESLRDTILDVSPDADVQRTKDTQRTMDFGTTLAIVLAGPAVVSIAKGIQRWLALHRGVELEISTESGRVIAKNITANQIEAVLKAATTALNQKP